MPLWRTLVSRQSALHPSQAAGGGSGGGAPVPLTPVVPSAFNPVGDRLAALPGVARRARRRRDGGVCAGRSAVATPRTASRRPSSPRCAPIPASTTTATCAAGCSRSPIARRSTSTARTGGGRCRSPSPRSSPGRPPSPSSTRGSGRWSGRCRRSSAPRWRCATPATSPTPRSPPRSAARRRRPAAACTRE